MRYFPNHETDIYESDPATLRGELEQAEETIRDLLHQVEQERARIAEAVQVYNNVVAKLMLVSRDQAALEADRDMWRQRVEQGPSGTRLSPTPAEASAIRKAMARLHHPDTGGNPERMKQWNAVLDLLEP